MRGNRNVDWRAAQKLQAILGDMGWTPADLERASGRTGHPDRAVSKRSVYRVLSQGHKPTNPVQFEIAAAVGLLPSHIWGDRPLPASDTQKVEAVAC
jgi:lambda repressor-like predicted transcriptional regulator